MNVKLTRKLAECIDGVNLSGRIVGEILDLAPRDARLLPAHGWSTIAPEQIAMDHPPSTASPHAIDTGLTGVPVTVDSRLREDEEPA